MSQQSVPASLLLGICVLLGLLGLGFLLGNAAIDFKQLDRSVTVKGLSEREYPADVVIWPIQFTAASNDLGALYAQVDGNAAKIKTFLVSKGIAESEISYGAPSIVDKSANQYGGGPRPEFRYSATQNVTVYSESIGTVRDTMSALSELGREGIVFTGGNYDAQTEYLFTSLNEVKPAMVEEATRKAREVAEKFAEDSESRLGKIKRASQGQFSIRPRDKNNPHIKKIRVVSTVEYYLSD